MSQPTPQFSALLPVYAGDQAEFVRRAIDSITTDQVLPPSELVVVVDGPVGADIEAVLAETVAAAGKAKLPPLRLLRLASNQGLAQALNTGLAACRYDIVARADADDISLPERFAHQVPLVAQDYDVVGTAIQEFSDDEQQLGLVRPLPTGQAELERYARFQSPFHHPSVVYRRSLVLEAGGYQVHRMEDYLLWSRLLRRGARVANLAEVLVLYRVGAGAYDRRGGLELARAEWQLQRIFRREGFTSPAQQLRNLAVRLVYRLLPVGLRRLIYRQGQAN